MPTSCVLDTHRIWPTSRSLRCSPPCGLPASSSRPAQEASTKDTPIRASWMSGQRRSVQVSTKAPSSAAASADDLHRPALRLEAQRIGRDDTDAGDLRDRQVDEHDAALQYLRAQRHMRGQHQQAGQQRRQQDVPIEGFGRHGSALSRRCTVSSKSENRSLACSSPPTVNGSTTIGSLVRSASQSAAAAVVVGGAQDHLRRAAPAGRPAPRSGARWSARCRAWARARPPAPGPAIAPGTGRPCAARRWACRAAAPPAFPARRWPPSSAP